MTSWKFANTAILLGLIMVIPVALSIFFFSGQSLRLDEAQSLWQTSRSVPDIFTIVASDVHVPFYHLLLHFWRLYLGDGVVAARMMSLLFYLLSIPALYFLGKLSYGRPVGLFAAFLFAISPFMNWYGNEIRMYTLFTFFIVLNQYFFLRLFRSRQPGDRTWIGYILTAVFGVFSHYFFFLNLAAQAVFYFLNRGLFPTGSLRKFTVALVVIVAAFIPWAWYVFATGQAGFSEPLLEAPTTVNLFSAFSQFLFGFQNDNINTVLLSLWPLTIGFVFLALRHHENSMLPETKYFLCTVLVSVGLAFIVSFLVTPIFVSRYLIFTVPSLYLLLGSLFLQYEQRAAMAARWALGVVMLGMLAVEIASPTTPVKEDYVDAVDYLDSHATAQDTVVVSAPFTIYPVEYYYRGPAPLKTLPIWNQYVFGPIPAFAASTLPSDVVQVSGESQNLYLLLSYDQGYEKDIKQYFDTHFKLVYSRNFSNDLNLYVYKLRYDTSLTAASTTTTR